MDEGDDGDDIRINFQEPSAAGNPKTPQIGKPCGPTCRKNCSRKTTKGRRMQIFHAYWKISYPDRNIFLFHMVSQQQTKWLTTSVPTKRKWSHQYHLNDDQGQRQNVCKIMFLTTLGYHPKNDRLITIVFGNATSSCLAPPQDRRGKHTPGNKLDLTPIFQHIESFHPCTSHYQREHAPNLLQAEISEMILWNLKEGHEGA